jgi:hypothetical protein
MKRPDIPRDSGAVVGCATSDKEWAEQEARDLLAEANEYERLIRTHGRNALWVEAMREDRETAHRLFRLAKNAR